MIVSALTMRSAKQFLKPVSIKTTSGKKIGQFAKWLEECCETLGMRMARYYYMQMALGWETLGISAKEGLIEGLQTEAEKQIRPTF